MASRHRNFIFTHNNYTDTVLEDTLECRYIAYAHEVGESGTPHLQGYVSFANAKTKAAVIKLMPGCHISVMVGTLSQNETYCSKSNDLIERGVKPMTNDNKGRAEKDRWDRAWTSAKTNKLDEIDSQLRIRHYSTFQRIAADYSTPPVSLADVCGWWIFGATGTGKTYAVAQAFPGRYIKSFDKWWPLYQNQEVVHIEEVSPENITGLARNLKVWADPHPFQAAVKFAGGLIRPKMIIVTSNYKIEEMGFHPYDVPPLLRKFKQIEKLNQEQVIDFSVR